MTQTKMSAVVHHALHPGAIELREIARPAELAPDEVLFQTRAVGVCGSEIHQYHNTQSWNVRVPVVLGHEFAGVVAKTGTGVKGFREGDRVTSETAARICGRCVYCLSGEYNLCPERLGFGYGVDGGMAGFVKVPARCLHSLPDSITFEQAALTEPSCVAYNATCVKTNIRPGESVLILGPGPVGLLCLMFAKLSGASWVGLRGLKIDAKRLNIARSLGADETFDGADGDALKFVRSLGDGLGVDAVIDASGASQAFRLALSAVRPSGQITKVGWGPKPLDFSLDPLVQKAVCLRGSFSHNFPIWEKVIALMAARKFDPLPLVGRVEPLEKWRDCFEDMAAGKIVKAVLKPND